MVDPMPFHITILYATGTESINIFYQVNQCLGTYKDAPLIVTYLYSLKGEYSSGTRSQIVNPAHICPDSEFLLSSSADIEPIQ